MVRVWPQCTEAVVMMNIGSGDDGYDDYDDDDDDDDDKDEEADDDDRKYKDYVYGGC